MRCEPENLLSHFARAQNDADPGQNVETESSAMGDSVMLTEGANLKVNNGGSDFEAKN